MELVVALVAQEMAGRVIQAREAPILHSPINVASIS